VLAMWRDEEILIASVKTKVFYTEIFKNPHAKNLSFYTSDNLVSLAQCHCRYKLKFRFGPHTNSI
jgi:hypothetical protein